MTCERCGAPSRGDGFCSDVCRRQVRGARTIVVGTLSDNLPRLMLRDIDPQVLVVPDAPTEEPLRLLPISPVYVTSRSRSRYPRNMRR